MKKQLLLTCFLLNLFSSYGQTNKPVPDIRVKITPCDKYPDNVNPLKDVYTFKLKNKIQLVFSKEHEIHNNCFARDLKILINNKDVTSKYTTSKTADSFDFYTPISADSLYIYVPSFNGAFLINTQTLKPIKIQSAGWYFYGNLFNKNNDLLTIGSKDVVLSKIKTNQNIRITPKDTDDYKIQWAFFVNQKSFVIIYNDFKENKQFWRLYNNEGKDLGLLNFDTPAKIFGFDYSKYKDLIDSNQFALSPKQGGQLNTNMFNTWQFASYNNKTNVVYCWTPVPCSEIFTTDSTHKFCEVELKDVRIEFK